MISSNFFKKISEHLNQKLPFVVFRKPREIKVKVIFQKSSTLHFLNDYSESGFIFAPFDSKKPPVLLKSDETFELSGFQFEKEQGGAENLAGEEQGGKTFYIALVKKAMSEIEAGYFDKVVISRSLKLDCQASSLDLFHNLLCTYDNAFCYLWYHPKVGLWLGATPEILLTVYNQRLTTMSLAGTQPYTNDERPQWGNKEIEEQALVTNYIEDALKGKVKNLSRTDVETVRAGNLMHLRTKISGSIEKGSLGRIIRTLHPTPAVCGLPKEITKKFILSNENHNREFYTGYLGELNVKFEKQRNNRTLNQENQAYKSIVNTTELFVNLRCMQLKDKIAYIYIGGGITKDSDPDKEWLETVAKSETMMRILTVLVFFTYLV